MLCTVAAAWSDASFAGLVITARGDEEFDISTGITTLVDGGEIYDRTTGMGLVADFIRYRVDEFIETRGTEVSGPFGTVRAEFVDFDMVDGILTAGGSLELTADEVVATAQALSFHLESGVMDISGSVTATAPGFSAERVLLSTESGVVLLLAPYEYDDGFLLLRSTTPGAMLELIPQLDDEAGADAWTEGPGQFAASTIPQESTLELFGPYLP